MCVSCTQCHIVATDKNNNVVSCGKQIVMYLNKERVQSTRIEVHLTDNISLYGKYCNKTIAGNLSILKLTKNRFEFLVSYENSKIAMDSDIITDS